MGKSHGFAMSDFRLIYHSKANAELDETSMPALLHQARRSNRGRLLTGALVLHKGAITHLLEGPQVSVMAVMKKIKADPRHREVEVVLSANHVERVFPEDALDYVSLHPDYLKEKGGLPPRTAMSLEKLLALHPQKMLTYLMPVFKDLVRVARPDQDLSDRKVRTG